MLRWAKRVDAAAAKAEISTFSGCSALINGLITIQEHTSQTHLTRRLLIKKKKMQQLMKVSEAAHLRTQIASDLPLLSGAGGPLKHMCNIKNKSRSHQPATKVARLLPAWRFFFLPSATQRAVLQP